MKLGSFKLLTIALYYTASFSLWAAKIEFEVIVPRNFIGLSEIYLSGAPKEMGAWEPRALILKNLGNRFFGKVEIQSTDEIEYKLNLGDWEQAETSANGGEIRNRLFKCPQDCKVQIVAENFRLPQFHPVPKTASHQIQYQYSFNFKALKNFRNLAIYLPPQYFSDPQRRFPVLYALDGNNLFDVATMRKGKEEWRIDETLHELNKNHEVAPFIVVGIYNTTKRADEYLNCEDQTQKNGGYAEEYAKFITDEIKPFIDRKYRTEKLREKTYLMGSSFGGSFTLFAMKYFGHVFSRFIAMSPAFWWSSYCLNGDLMKKQNIIPDKLWIDMGDREGWGDGALHFKTGVRDLNEAHKNILNSGIPEHHIRKVVEPGGLHNEFYWGRRFIEAIKFLDP